MQIDQLPSELQPLVGRFPIVPANSRKQPLVKWAQWTDRAQTAEELADLPVGDLYAIVTGRAHGLVVLDFDGDAGLTVAMGLKLAPNVITGSGGWHCWFDSFDIPHPVKTCAGVKPGVDVRGEGGLVYVAGTSSKGTYRIQSTDFINALPPVALFPEKKPAQGGAVPGTWDGDGMGTPAACRVLRADCRRVAQAAPGSRNATLCKSAYNVGGLVGSGELDPEAALSALLDAAATSNVDGQWDMGNAERTAVHQMSVGAEAPWSSEPKPDARGIKWRPVTDPGPSQVRQAAAVLTGDRPDWQKDLQPVPYGALPPAVAALVKEAAPVMSCPETYLVAACITALGAGIGGLVTLHLREGWRIPPSMYVGLVGAPGTAKSPALRRALAPLQETEADGWRNANPDHRMVVDDVTTEKLVELLGESPRGLIQTVDELKGFFSGMGAYKEGLGRDRQFYLSAWDGQTIRVDRIKRGTIYVPRPTLSVIGGIQPSVFDNLSLGEEDGMLERFLFVWGDRVPEQWGEADLSPSTLAEYAGLWAKVRTFGSQEQKLHLSTDGTAAWIEWYNPFHNDVHRPEKLQFHWNKVRTHVARLALILAVCDAETEVGPEHVRNAVTLTEWFLSHMLHVFRNAQASTSDERRHVRNRERLAQFIEDWTEEFGSPPTPSEVLRKGPPGSRRAKDRDMYLDELGVVLPTGGGK